jgi:hypothetical protein
MSLRSARRRLASAALSIARKPSGVREISKLPDLIPKELGNLSALELPALNTFAVIVFM